MNLPYKGTIPGGLSPERTIVINGKVPSGSSRFKVNFVMSRGNNIAFHMGVRVGEGVVARNTQIGGTWTLPEEETWFNQGVSSPFAAGKTFVMSVRCTNTFYQVSVDGKQLFNYNHRILDLSDIDRLDIDGQVELTSVNF